MVLLSEESIVAGCEEVLEGLHEESREPGRGSRKLCQPFFTHSLQHVRHKLLYAIASDRRRVDMAKNVSALDA